MALLSLLAAAAAAAAPVNAQTLFDRAGAAFEAGQYQAAADDYAALETRLAGGRNKATLAIVRVRRGNSLAKLGRSDEAATAIRAGLATFPDPGDPSGDRLEGLLTLGLIAEQALDYPAARREFEGALAIAPAKAGGRLDALAGIARTTMFDDPARARTAADAAQAMLTAEATKPLVAQVRTLRGLVMLNAGDARGALAELKQATVDLGGAMTTKVDRLDVEARSDVAIAALLLRDDETARKYLAYTGAGRTKVALPGLSDLSLPPCGEPDDIRPDDVVVVQFAIAASGAIADVRPIYASRKGPMAMTFAKAVAGWSWTPEQIAQFPPFFRQATRLQLRCSKGQQRPDVLSQLDGIIAGWLAEKGVGPAPGNGTGDQARALDADRAIVAQTVPGAEPLKAVPAMLGAAGSQRLPADERLPLLMRAEAALAREGAPGEVRAAARAKRLVDEAYRPAGDDGTRRPSHEIWRSRYEAWQANRLKAMRAAIADPELGREPRVAAVVALSLVDALARDRGNAEERGALLRRVIDDPRLPASDPLRTGALVRQAAWFVERRDLEAARASYARTGLNAQQCALVDARPALVRSGASSSDFPMEAYAWGFEGWVRQEFDITAEGRPREVRTIVAYPPFVFEKAGQAVVGKARFQQSYRPEGGLGCSAETQSVNFMLPR